MCRLWLYISGSSVAFKTWTSPVSEVNLMVENDMACNFRATGRVGKYSDFQQQSYPDMAGSLCGASQAIIAQAPAAAMGAAAGFLLPFVIPSHLIAFDVLVQITTQPSFINRT